MTPKASFKKIVDFLTLIGSNHTDVNSVYRWNRLELDGAMRSGATKSIMLIDAIEVNTDSPGNNNLHLNQCAITILGKEGVSTAKIDSYDAQNDVLEHCQNIAFEIAARLIREADDYAANKWLYGNLEKGSFSFFKVGPVFTENLYGYRCEFTIKSLEDYSIDYDKWADLQSAVIPQIIEIGIVDETVID
jgi:hypothetical protein